MELQLAAIFKENMVLQREKPIAVFGRGEAGREVSVSVGTSHSRTVVKADGSWRVCMPPLAAGDDLILTVEDGQSRLSVGGVAVGEVWLAGGQSNMELPLCDSEDGDRAARTYAGRQVRCYHVPDWALVDDTLTQMEAESQWQIISPDNAGQMSAIAFYFAERLAKEMDCTVGIVECFRGGSSIACWIDRDLLASVRAGQKQLAEYTELVGGKGAEEYAAEMAAYDRQVQTWQDGIDACSRVHPDFTLAELRAACGEPPWPQPAGWQSPFAPGNLHASMIERIAPYTLRGFLYYQGEEDVCRCEGYYDQMERLVRQWRADFRDWELPFLFVQLPMYLAAGETDDAGWAKQRMQQELAFRLLKNTGMITMTDCGEYNNVHPLDKKTPADRLFRLAERMVYDADGRNDKEITPIMQSMYSDGENMYLTFYGVGDGLVLRKTEKPTFEAAGADGIFYPAQAEIADRDTVRVCCDGCGIIFQVRYAWYNFGEAALFTSYGLPVSSFHCEV